jgi:hypothetical protein
VRWNAVDSVYPTNVNTPLFMNEGTMKLFRPDFEVAAQFMHDRATSPGCR